MHKNETSGRAARGNCKVTRRIAIGRTLAGLAGAVGVHRAGFAKSKPSTGGATLVERLASGTEIWQVTAEEYQQSNIYCEIPYCSGDSRRFVYERRNPKQSAPNHKELMVVELGTWKQHRLDGTVGILGTAIVPDGTFYYLKGTAGDAFDLMRANLSKGEPSKVAELAGKGHLTSLGTVTPDGRYYAIGKRLDREYKSFGILLVDLKTGKSSIIDRDPFILNPHPQFELGEGKQLMIQHNRGGRYSPDGKLERLVGPEGATLYVLDVADGSRTELQVGKPFTTPATGHEAWIGNTKEILLTVSASGDFAPEKGNLLGVRAGQPARVVARGYWFQHVGVSRCGRFFCCDDWQGTCKVVIGSIKTGKTAVVCESKASRKRGQNTHPHPYLTPDLKWVIFNSDRSGFPHVHAASVPEQTIAELSKA